MKNFRLMLASGMALAALASDAAVAAEPVASKSIIDPKYRERKEPDWLATVISGMTTKTREKQVTKVDPENPDAKITTTVQVEDGIDIEKLFALGTANGLEAKIAKFRDQVDSHGFAGRFRMTMRNMLQAVAKQRHGIVGLDGAFVSAPADWLEAKKAPEAPTHLQDGTRVAKPTVKAAEAPATETAEDADEGSEDDADEGDDGE